MPNTNIPCATANPAMLLLEPNTLGYSERAVQLGRAHFCVTKAASAQDIYLLRGVFRFTIALLSDKVGFLALRASAQMVRRQWPEARILILGNAPSQFDDQLYDESVMHASDGSTLLASIKTFSDHPWKNRGGTLSAWLNHVSVAPRQRQHSAIQESDPTKLAGLAREADHARNLPAAEQQRRFID